MTVVPPIKSQGIKSKLVNWIGDSVGNSDFERWVEPFMGTGAVAFNIQPRRALLCDSNPHLVNFYKAVQSHEVTGSLARAFLREEGARLRQTEGEHYYVVRERFNKKGNPLDFLFLSRSCFNGMMRFNKKGGFNVPFCRKPERFAQALTTKIANQIDAVSHVIDKGGYEFKHQEFESTLQETNKNDMVYCDPPYIGRHVDYFDSWSEADEVKLHSMLASSGARFVLSTWFKNRHRHNEYVFSLWKNCSIAVKEHFYHVGGREVNRNAVYEALLTNFGTPHSLPVDNISVNSFEGVFSDRQPAGVPRRPGQVKTNRRETSDQPTR